MGSTCRLDLDDLDDEDRAILQEVTGKGYYHGRPKNEVCPPPQRIEEASDASSQCKASESRASFDEFQKKWDAFDNDDFVKSIEQSAERDAGNNIGLSSASSSAQEAGNRQQAVTQGLDFLGSAPPLLESGRRVRRTQMKAKEQATTTAVTPARDSDASWNLQWPFSVNCFGKGAQWVWHECGQP